MSLIFDRFPSIAEAEEFLAAVKEQHRIEGQLFTDEEGAQQHDLFPWKLDPPIVHIDRTDHKAEREIESLVEQYGGTFAGT